MSEDNQLTELTYKTNPDCGLISFFVDGKFVTEWSYDDDPQVSFNEFKMIFKLGQRDSLIKFANNMETQSNSKPDSLAKVVVLEFVNTIRNYLNEKHGEAKSQKGEPSE